MQDLFEYSIRFYATANNYLISKMYDAPLWELIVTASSKKF